MFKQGRQRLHAHIGSECSQVCELRVPQRAASERAAAVLEEVGADQAPGGRGGAYAGWQRECVLLREAGLARWGQMHRPSHSQQCVAEVATGAHGSD